MSSNIAYITIASRILRLPLSDKAKMLLGLVYSFNSNGLMMSNKELGDLLCCSPDNIGKLIKEIGDSIRVENGQSRYRKIFYSGEKSGVDTSYSDKKDGVKADSTPSQIPATPSQIPATPSQTPDIIKGTKQTQRNENVVARRLAELLMSLILEKLPSFREGQSGRKERTLQRWAADIDKMIRLDHRTPENIEAVMCWARADNFWQSNILSASKLRDKFDTLESQSKRKKHGENWEYPQRHKFVAATNAINI